MAHIAVDEKVARSSKNEGLFTNKVCVSARGMSVSARGVWFLLLCSPS